MPGTDERRRRECPRDVNVDVIGAVLRFTDAAGVRWLSRPDGQLDEQR